MNPRGLARAADVLLVGFDSAAAGGRNVAAAGGDGPIEYRRSGASGLIASELMAPLSGSGLLFFSWRRKSLYPGGSFRMSAEVMESYIRQTIEAHSVPKITIAWQGGEPTLMGDRKSTRLNSSHLGISYAVF